MMTPDEFDQIRRAGDISKAIYQVYQSAVEKWLANGIDGLTVGELTAICVETTYFEVEDNGFFGFEDGQSAQFFAFCPAALRRVGLPEFADLVEEAVSRCSLFEDDEEIDEEEQLSMNAPWVMYLAKEEFGVEPYEDLDERFYGLVRADPTRIRQKLFDYIVDHEGEFVSSPTS